MDSQVTKRLSTFLPIEVFQGFTDFCKVNAVTGFQKWDYGVGLRILLMKAQYADMIFEIEQRVCNLENQNQPKVNEIPKGFYEEKTLGSIKTKEVVNGKI